jgi:hypothetical protein
MTPRRRRSCCEGLKGRCVVHRRSGYVGLSLATLSAQQREGRRGPRLPTAEELPQEVATLRQLVPTNSTIMMDVQWHWTNLWWAGKRKN